MRQFANLHDDRFIYGGALDHLDPPSHGVRFNGLAVVVANVDVHTNYQAIAPDQLQD